MRKKSYVIFLAGGVVGAAFLAALGDQRPAGSPAPSLVAQREFRANPRDGAGPAAMAQSGWIGLMFEEQGRNGVRVKSVFPGGPAAIAGVREGDLVTRIGDASVKSPASAEEAIERLVPRRPASLTVERRGKPIELKVIPDSLAEFREMYVHEMLRRDPRDAKYGQNHGVSEADMSVELVRRLFEQHERMERTLNDVLKEVHALRKELRTLRR